MSKGKYDDIIDLPYKKSTVHKPMSMENRAAQFSPFAALTGHDAAIKETARLTDSMADLSQDQKEFLDEKLRIIAATIGTETIFSFTYFVPDQRKYGGKYITHSASVKKIDFNQGIIILDDGEIIEIKNISRIDGEIFQAFQI